MFDEGHTVALHSDTRTMIVRTPEEVAAILTQNADRIERLAGSPPCRLFRPHAGWRSASMYEGLARIDHTLVGWSWGLWDWNWFQRRDDGALARRLARRASPGDIVVMHDGHHIDPEADRRYAVEATRGLIIAMNGSGFVFGSLCSGGAYRPPA
jgi:peptidoglycan/xylan/chitin deacetylase (PgdA/CDA1 family)